MVRIAQTNSMLVLSGIYPPPPGPSAQRKRKKRGNGWSRKPKKICRPGPPPPPPRPHKAFCSKCTSAWLTCLPFSFSSLAFLSSSCHFLSLIISRLFVSHISFNLIFKQITPQFVFCLLNSDVVGLCSTSAPVKEFLIPIFQFCPQTVITRHLEHSMF